MYEWRRKGVLKVIEIGGIPMVRHDDLMAVLSTRPPTHLSKPDRREHLRTRRNRLMDASR